MKRSFLVALVVLCFIATERVYSQNMTNDKLERIVRSMADSIQGKSGNWQFLVKEPTYLTVFF